MYMLTGHARGREAPQAKTLPIIDGHGLVSIWQEHDIPAHPRPLHPFAQIMNPTMLALAFLINVSGERGPRSETVR
jgi:hypothetical protein